EELGDLESEERNSSRSQCQQRITGLEWSTAGKRIPGSDSGNGEPPWFPSFLARLLPALECREIATCFPDAILDDRTAIAVREVGKSCAEIPRGQRIRVGLRFDRLKLSPRQQFIGGQEGKCDLAGPLGSHLDALAKLLRVGQKELQVERSCGIEDLD